MATVVAALRCIVYFTVVGIFATERSRPGVFRAMLKTVIESCCPWSFVPLVVRFLSKTFHAQGNSFSHEGEPKKCQTRLSQDSHGCARPSKQDDFSGSINKSKT